MLKAVIFDFDGVITDSEILHLNAFNKTLSSYGVKLSNKEYYSDYLGLNDVDLCKKLIDQSRLNITYDDIDEIVQRKKVIFRQLAESDGNIIDGAVDFIKLLDDNNITMAICSGALLSEIELTLQKASLRHHFVEIVSAEFVRRGKPDPEGYLLALKKLNQQSAEPIAAGDCVVIEDSFWGIDAAHTAKMPVIAVTTTYDAEQLTSAEKIVDRLDEITIEDLQLFCS